MSGDRAGERRWWLEAARWALKPSAPIIDDSSYYVWTAFWAVYIVGRAVYVVTHPSAEVLLGMVLLAAWGGFGRWVFREPPGKTESRMSRLRARQLRAILPLFHVAGMTLTVVVAIALVVLAI